MAKGPLPVKCVGYLSIRSARKVDFYQRLLLVEKAYQDRDPFSPSTCARNRLLQRDRALPPLGELLPDDAWNVHGSGGFKQPGYRSVKRVVKPEDGSERITIYAKQVHGEWRIAATEADSELKFEETMPEDNLVDGGADAGEAGEQFRAWSGADLTSGAWDVSVVVWQWCRGVPERHGNLMALADDWWCPYLADANSTIETAFARSDESTKVGLLGKELMIKFTRGQSFALQRNEAEGKERAVRRVVKTVQEVKVMLDKMATPPIDASELAEHLPAGTVPHHFYCPITQDVMMDPVKTVDGMTYDRPAIERWFSMSNTSPLTGLPLASRALVPHTSLREQIQAFVESNAHVMQQQQGSSGESTAA